MTADAPPRRTRPVTEIEISIDNPSYPFIVVTEHTNCVIELVEMLPREGGRYAEFFNITGIPPDRIVSLTASHDTLDVSLLREYEDGGLFEFIASGNCPAFALAELGALPRKAMSVAGEGRIVAEIPQHYDPAVVVTKFLEENPDAQLVAKREKDSFTPLVTNSAAEQFLASTLTDRQREVLETAFECGYFEWPRRCTGEEVAEELGITSATFSEHIHAAERKLLTVLLDRQMNN